MTLSVTTQASPFAAKLVQETSASATPDNNVTSAAGVLYLVDIDNSANPAAVYLKVFNNAAPVVGTTPADLVFMVAANTRRSYSMIEGIAFAALSFACVTGASQANVTSPANPVIVRLLAS
jgi:hypothetical protein